jgi:hypothetical protein
MFEKYRLKAVKEEEELVLASSADLFYYYRQTMISFTQYSTKNAFAELSDLFGKWLSAYGELLISKLPRYDKIVFYFQRR